MTEVSEKSLLDRYFDRVGYQGPIEPTIDVLKQLHLLHPQSIPFENIAPYTGQGVHLSLDAISEKLINQRRGGYCFEHNTLFLAVLRKIGFNVTPLIARVRWQVPAEVETGLTHMLLCVELEGRSWLVDVAFGSTTQTAPLELLFDVPQVTPHGLFRIVNVGSGLGLEFQTPSGWHSVYHYSLSPAVDIDFELGNWYTSTHPDSFFLKTLLISRTQPGARQLMENDVYTCRDNSGDSQKYRYTDATDWADCLSKRFDLHLAPKEVESLFQRVLNTSAETAATENSSR